MPLNFGRPWQYDMMTWYDCRANAYCFDWKGRKLRLLSLSTQLANKKNGKVAFLNVTGTQLPEEYKDSSHFFMLVGAEIPALTKNSAKEI